MMTLLHEMKPADPDFETLLPQLMGFCIKKLHRKGLSEDIAQETIARYFANLEKGVEIKNARAWMFQVARNLIVDYCRSNQPYCVGDDWGEIGIDSSSLEDDSEQVFCIGGREVMQSKMLLVLPEAIKKLTRADRDYLNDYYLNDASYGDLACNEGISVTATKGRMYRARQRLRAQLEAEVLSK